MLYSTAAPTPVTRHLIQTGSTHTPEGLQQNKRSVFFSLPIVLALLSVSLSACATQSLSPTHSVLRVQAEQQPHARETTPSAVTQAAEHPNNTAADIFARGKKALEAGRYEHAIDLFGQAIQLDANNALYYLWLGRAYGHQAEQTKAGEQFFLARQVRKNLEKAVTLNPDLIEARLDLLTYYLQAPSLLGGGIEKAQVQAGEIAKRNPQQGALAWQQCQRAEKEGVSLLAGSH